MSKFAIILRADKWSHCFYHPPILRYHLFHLFVVRTVGYVLDESTNQGAQPFVLRSQFFFAFFHLGFCFGVPSLPLRLHRTPHPFKSYFFLIFPSACIKIGRKSVSLQSFTLARWLRPPFGKGDFRLTDILLPRFQCSLFVFECKDKNFFGDYC